MTIDTIARIESNRLNRASRDREAMRAKANRRLKHALAAWRAGPVRSDTLASAMVQCGLAVLIVETGIISLGDTNGSLRFTAHANIRNMT